MKLYLTFALIFLVAACGQEPQATLRRAHQNQVGNEVPEIFELELCRKQGPLSESGAGGFLSFLPPDALLCRAKPDLAKVFEGVGLVFGTMTVVCTFPGPVQAALPVFAVGAATTSILAFGLKGISCDDPLPRLTAEQEDSIERKVCDLMGKRYHKGLGPVDQARCL